MISIKELRVDYDDVCAVDDLSIEIEAGDVFGLIGPNGAGKTSTIRVLAGLLEPTYGDILIGGVDVVHDAEKARKLVVTICSRCRSTATARTPASCSRS